MSPDADDTTPDPAELAADLLGHDLLQALVDELKVAPDVWQRMGELQQEETIERLRRRTRTLVTQSMRVLFSGHYPACEATIEGIRIKRGLVVNLKIAKGAQNWHDIVEAEGQRVLLVIADPDQYTAQMDKIKAAAAQGELFNGTYEGTREFRRGATPPPIDSSWQELMDSLRDTDAPAETEPLEFGGAQTPVKSMGEQCRQALDAVFVFVDAETAAAWSEQECVVAYHWAVTYLKSPDEAPARPHWLPLPQPPVTDQEMHDTIPPDAENGPPDDDPVEDDDEDP